MQYEHEVSKYIFIYKCLQYYGSLNAIKPFKTPLQTNNSTTNLKTTTNPLKQPPKSRKTPNSTTEEEA